VSANVGKGGAFLLVGGMISSEARGARSKIGDNEAWSVYLSGTQARTVLARLWGYRVGEQASALPGGGTKEH